MIKVHCQIDKYTQMMQLEDSWALIKYSAEHRSDYFFGFKSRQKLKQLGSGFII